MAVRHAGALTGELVRRRHPSRGDALTRFVDRADAARLLAERLRPFTDEAVVVLGLPRGGVPVAAVVADALGAPLDVVVVRKLGVPSQPELGMGAIGEDGARIVNDEVVRQAGVSQRELVAVEALERVELARRARLLRSGRHALSLAGKVAVVVDDGVATGSTARVACRVARARGSLRVVLAVPVAPWGWEARIGADADACIALVTPSPFWAVGQFYRDFSPVSDDEVIGLLARASGHPR